MKIGTVNNGINFKGAIIDSHIHYGHFPQKENPNNLIMYGANELDQFVKSPLEVTVKGTKQVDNVERAIISNLDCMIRDGMANETDGNKAMLDFCAKNPNYYPLIACQPTKTNGNAKHIAKLLKENPDKFVGLKFHPRGLQGQDADGFIYRAYLRLAQKHQLPCVFHCDAELDEAGKIKFRASSPEAIYYAGREFPDVPIVMAHMGAGNADSHKNAMQYLFRSIDNGDAKLYVDLSWVDWGNNGLSSDKKPSVVTLIKELQKRNATDRILFGTDAPLGCFGERPEGGLSPKQAYEKSISDLKTVIKENFGSQADDLINKIFYKNAEDLFFKKEWLKPQNDMKKVPSASKLLGIAALAIAGISGISYICHKCFAQNSSKDTRFDK